MIQRNVLVSVVLLPALSVITLSGQDSRPNTLQRPWPGAYPEPISLKGLRRVALRVYTDRGIPSGRISSGPFSEEIQRRAVQELRKASITLAKEDEAEAILSLEVYLVCQADSPSCGYHTDLKLKQWVQLHRDTSIAVAATTWSNSYTNAISKNQVQCCLPDRLTVDAHSLLIGFVRDFQKANSQ